MLLGAPRNILPLVCGETVVFPPANSLIIAEAVKFEGAMIVGLGGAVIGAEVAGG